jgi:hypothetical protein
MHTYSGSFHEMPTRTAPLPRSFTAVASRRSCRSDGTALLSLVKAMKQSRAERRKSELPSRLADVGPEAAR